MIRYDGSVPETELEHWPFDNPASAYRILEGAPRASGRLDAGGAGRPTRTGIWRCTPGVFECTEQGDELMTVLEGRGRLFDHGTGDTHDLSPGDTLFLRDQSRVTWHIEETLTKVFFAHKPGGY
ncbi:cupin domain-containing protein [Roseovarius sp. SCSIO 43702]|uniref:cupin domain-containing protein n=1 Tax=Roseovarius sp. SCSIO 43702 TaxID=2823043 RepID=UPI001C72A0C0|nr:cupin domain-containing protein [Roseovarius sp. SCSIO 43702]QYX57352.1 cupin domain-containing protein [Roseovarius sp. SCSIO 43702]